DDAATSPLIDGAFDPFTAGLLDGLEKNLLDEMYEGQAGDRDLAAMLLSDLGWMEDYRVRGLPKTLRSEVMQWHLDCDRDTRRALKHGAVPIYLGACESTA